jgi:predicted CXXCH cytochrome family protein
VTVSAILCVLAGSHPASAGPSHDQVACDRCHAGSQASPASGGVGDTACRGCHADALRSDAGLLAFHVRPDRGCLDCHAFHAPEEIRAGAAVFRFAHGDAAVRGLCRSCHAPGGDLAALGDDHRAAAAVFHVDSSRLAGLTPSQSCLLCHGDASGDARAQLVASVAPRFAEHASHPYGVAVRPGFGGGFPVRQRIDGRLELFEGRIECQTCHSLVGGTDDLLVVLDGPDGLCLGCHGRAGTPRSAVAATPVQPESATASASRAAATVVSMSASVWAADTKPTSQPDGAR